MSPENPSTARCARPWFLAFLNTMNVIYQVTNKVNGKQYIGQTRQGFNRRKSQHIASARFAFYPFPKAIAKYGAAAFDWEVFV